MPSPLRRSSRHHPSITAADRKQDIAHIERRLSMSQRRKRKAEFVANTNDAVDTIKKTRNAVPASTNKKVVKTMKSPVKMINTSRRKRGAPTFEHEDSEKQNIQPRKPERKLEARIGEIPTTATHSQNLIPEPEQRINARNLTKEAEDEMTVKEVIFNHLRSRRMQYENQNEIIRFADKTIRQMAMSANYGNIRDGANTLTVLSPEKKGSLNETPRTETASASKTQSSSKVDSPFSPTVHDEDKMWSALCQLPQEFESLPDEEFNVEGQRYVRLTSLLNEEGFTVPVAIPVTLQLPRVQEVVRISLVDAFKANHIPVKRRSLARWVYIILKEANLLVHKAFYELLYDFCDFNIMLTKEMEKPLEELPSVSLERCKENTVAYVNGLDLSVYEYKPRSIQYSKSSSQTNPNVSSITYVQYLNNYIKKFEKASFEEVEEISQIGKTRKTPSPEMNQSISSNGIPLTIRVLICSGFDAGSKEIDLAANFALPLHRIEAVISSYATNIRELTNFLQANKERYPGTYIGLNIMMWRFFRDCRNKKLKLDDTLLKEHSKRLALQLGLIDFRATDAWMNAFKRRHWIDLSTMCGRPVSYREDDEAVVCLIEPQCDQPSIDAECSACPSPDLEAARPIDLINMSLERHESTSVDRELRENPQTRDDLPGPSSEVNGAQVELELIKSLVRSTTMHCPDSEIASALNTIRCYILHTDPKLLTQFTDLQTKISYLAIEKGASNKALAKEKIDNLRKDFSDL